MRVERGLAHLLLKAEADQAHHHDSDDRYHHQPAGKHRDEDQEQEQESDIDQQHDGGRGKEIAHQRIFGNTLGHCPGASLARRHRQVHDLFEQLLAELGVELEPDFIDQS